MRRFQVAVCRACVLALVSATATAATISVRSLSGVLDADGVTPLQGSGLGNAASDKIQVLYAGPNGTIQPPDIDGGPTGDDELLETSEYAGQLYTVVGEGFPFNPNEGKFTEDFVHSLNAGAKIYVRAWNSPVIGESAKYGDSQLYTITNVQPESHNFGTWSTNRSVQQLSWGGRAAIGVLGMLLAALAAGYVWVRGRALA